MDEQDFLRAIKTAAPGRQRLEARLVYADWLDDHGDPRGELIRIYCEVKDIAYRKIAADPKAFGTTALRGLLYPDVFAANVKLPSRGQEHHVARLVKKFNKLRSEIVSVMKNNYYKWWMEAHLSGVDTDTKSLYTPTESKFRDRLEQLLTEEHDQDFTSAVAIVQNRNKWLLGLANNTGDGRTGKWCHPGGHIKRGETPEKAAVREAWEETGVRCKAVGDAFRMPGYKNIAFVHCKVTNTKQKLNNNHEFSALGFFKFDELKSLKLFGNAKKLIERVR